jgi:hypothetical protein
MLAIIASPVSSTVRLRKPIHEIGSCESVSDVDKVEQDKVRISIPTKRCASVCVCHDSGKSEVRNETSPPEKCIYEGTPFVVGASAKSLIVTLIVGRILMFNEWLIIYIWSAADKLPEIRSTEQGNDASVTE